MAPLEPIDADRPVDYLVGHVEEALACDPRVNQPGLHVRIVSGRVYIDGTVSTRARFDAVADVVAELLPGWTVCNQSQVADFPEPEASGMEALS